MDGGSRPGTFETGIKSPGGLTMASNRSIVAATAGPGAGSDIGTT
jgi:hypothetical protein